MQTRKLTTYALLLLLCWGCQKEEESYFFEKKTIKIFTEVQSRSAMESGFIPTDEIGIFMMARTSAETPAQLEKPEGNWINNKLLYMNVNSTWTSDELMYWKDSYSTLDMIAYYPYQMIGNTADIKSVPFQIEVNQQGSENLRKSELLYANATGLTATNNSTGVNLEFKHKLCKFTINLKFSESDLEEYNEITVIVNNVKYSGTINLSNGVISAQDGIKNIICCVNETSTLAEAILLPQTVSKGTLVTAQLSNANSDNFYSFYLNNDLILESGKEYTINFDCSTITSGIQVSSSTSIES